MRCSIGLGGCCLSVCLSVCLSALCWCVGLFVFGSLYCTVFGGLAGDGAECSQLCVFVLAMCCT